MFKSNQLAMCALSARKRAQVSGISYTWRPSYGKRGHRTHFKAGCLGSSLPGVDSGLTLGKVCLRVINWQCAH
jgi:hypothetical protein